jgi:uncharacterized protein (DUF2252 family)
MAGDLATQTSTGIEVQLCGDAHLSNFGLFAAPDRRILFDVNDFDETLRGPFEWDVKRLAASVAVAGRTLGFDDSTCRTAAASSVLGYRKAIHSLATSDTMDVWYWRVEYDQVLSTLKSRKSDALRSAKLAERQAEKRTSMQAFDKMTRLVNGQRRIIADPPLVVPLQDDTHGDLVGALTALGLGYVATLTEASQVLLLRYRAVDVALKVVGVGSVGTRALIVLLQGGDGEPLFLQFKEARESVLEPYLRPAPFDNHGQRVVAGQRLIQGSADLLLGWSRAEYQGDDLHFYFRQLRDRKGSIDPLTLDTRGLADYATLCGAVLARAHARSGDAATIDGYVGANDRFDAAIGAFAMAYADQTAKDHQALVDAVQSGRLEAIKDL